MKLSPEFYKLDTNRRIEYMLRMKNAEEENNYDSNSFGNFFCFFVGFYIIILMISYLISKELLLQLSNIFPFILWIFVIFAAINCAASWYYYFKKKKALQFIEEDFFKTKITPKKNK